MAPKGEQAGLSQRVLDALGDFGIANVGQLMDHFAGGEAKMIKDVAGSMWLG